MNGFLTAVSGGEANEIWLEKVTNNLANANTSGYKADYPSFEAVVIDAKSRTDAKNPTPSMVSIKLHDGIDMTSGSLKHTGNPLDLAIEGEGLFAISGPDGERYTRNGNFSVNKDGELVTKQGYPVLGANGAIVISGNDVNITGAGSVSVNGKEEGNLRIVSIDRNSLKKVGDNLFAKTGDATVTKTADVTIKQGFVESSNINVVREMALLINISRAYESYQKVVHSMEKVSNKSINEIGRQK